MTGRVHRRGQPVAAMAMILAGWIGARAMILEAGPASPLLRETAIATSATSGDAWSGSPVETAPASAMQRKGATTARGPRHDDRHSGSGSGPLPLPAMATAPVARPILAPVPARLAAGHLSMWMAAVAQMPMPLLAGLAPGADAPLGAPFGHDGRFRRADTASRWSADGWLMWRQGGRYAPSSGATGATYGASQTGAVLRYRLDPASRNRPVAYLRATAALNGSHEKEAAIGLSARPLARLPVVAAAELRASNDRAGTRLRPAAFAVTELGAFAMPLGLRGEAYLQAGYAGGRGSTPFVDGQLRFDRGLARIGRTELRAGGGVWGGAQKGTSRLDIGPAASIGMPVNNDFSARLGLDWRMRVAGNAAPSSGPAITLSAGF